MNGKEWYREQLKKPEWLAKRKKIYERDNRTCVDCQKSGIRIHCHHEHYVRGKKPWDYPPHAFVTLCDECHDNRHRAAIMKFMTHHDAEMWLMFSEVDKAMIEVELKERSERVEGLSNQGADWDSNGQYYSMIDENGEQRCFDADGNLM
ncbi:hypothetical protein [Aporhodopirellula aestuarii]|uniref:HNH endonuclease n=1 Tax=Aporhodopirellula aestuarii TaxID=2950107 RepID=A0ABT0U2C9_9BACT|nr:hypothetical protein [Aporhodopirellula aestuarii]MCM2371060.1 hypothetical protein [Aporhodopirellula aestuarii]